MTQAPSLIGRFVAHGHFNVIHNDSMMRADVYCAGSDELGGWALQRRVDRLELHPAWAKARTYQDPD